mgnify:CR=1 FL=1
MYVEAIAAVLFFLHTGDLGVVISFDDGFDIGIGVNPVFWSDDCT